MQDYGKRLREARKAKGLTQIQAAELCDLEQPNYQRIESGKSDIKISMLYKICKGLGISADFILGIEVNNKAKKGE